MNKKKLSYTVQFILIIFLFQNLKPQSQQIFPLYGFFPYIISNVTLNHRWDFNFTFYSAINAIDKTIHHIHYKPTDYYAFFQPSIIYKFSPHLNADVSYCYQRNNPFNEQYFNEHRFWEQITYTHVLHQWNFMTRLRYEERFIQNRTLHQYPFFSRIRYIIDFSKLFYKDFWLHNLYFMLIMSFLYRLLKFKIPAIRITGSMPDWAGPLENMVVWKQGTLCKHLKLMCPTNTFRCSICCKLHGLLILNYIITDNI